MRWPTDRGRQVESVSVAELAARYGRPAPDLPETIADMRDVAAYRTATT